MTSRKRTGSSLLHTINTAPTALMVTIGFTTEQAARIIQVRRVLPLMDDPKDPCIDARKLWEKIGKPHGRFNDWAESYIKPLIVRADLTTEISVLKVPARGVPRTEYTLSRDIAASLAMMARTPEGETVRAYFLDMERLAIRLSEHLGIRVTAIVGTDNKVAHMFIKSAAEDAKAGKLSRGSIRSEAVGKERLLKATVCEVLTGHSAAHWRETFGKGIRDVLDPGDILVYSQCYETAWVLINSGIRVKAKLEDILRTSYGGRVSPTKYTAKGA